MEEGREEREKGRMEGRRKGRVGRKCCAAYKKIQINLKESQAATCVPSLISPGQCGQFTHWPE